MEINEMSYEEGINELSKIIENLEAGDLTLTESLDSFKRGVEIYKHLNNMLNKVEGEIKIILKDDEEGEYEKLFKMED